VSHACNAGPTGGWYPPYCHTQYGAAVLDGVGGLGSTSTFQVYSADVAFCRGAASVALPPYAPMLSPSAAPTGNCCKRSNRFRDAAIQNIKFSIYAETGANRVRGAINSRRRSNSSGTHADIEIRSHGLVVDISRGQDGNRLNLYLTAQSF
jgi:hypothetical protein